MKKDWKFITKGCLIAVAILTIGGALAWFSLSSVRQKASTNFYKTAEGLLEKNKPDQTVLSLEKSIFLDPKNHKAFYLLGKIHRENLAINYALPKFKKAYLLQPKNDRYLLAFAESALKLSKEDYLVGILEDQPSHLRQGYGGQAPDLLNAVFFLTYLQKEEDKLASIYIQKIKDDDLKNYLENLSGLIKNLEYKLDSALKFKKFVIPEFVNWHLNLMDEELTKLAEFETNRAKTQNSETKELLVLNLLNELGFANLVVHKAQKFTDSCPDYRDGWLVLGKAQFLEQDYQSARETLETAEKLDPNYLPTLELLAETYKALDLFDQETDIRAKIEKLSH